MPRQPRLDALGTMHHIMGRGIEQTKVFRNETDREDFLNRLAEICEEGALIVYAWALMFNHFHILVRTGNQSLSKSMRRFLTGYVINPARGGTTGIYFRTDTNRSFARTTLIFWS